MKKTKLWLLAFVPFLALLMGARQIPLQDPAPIAVPAGVSQGAVAKSIKAALLEYRWMVTKDEPGHIEGKLDLRAHSVTIAIPYDAKEVRILYITSDNLLYEEKGGQKLIHRNYANWLKNVVTGIQRNLLMAQPTN
jgi:hypothetical protein